MRPRDIAARELERLELKHNGNTSAMARDLFSEYPGLFKSVLAVRAILRRVKEKTPEYHQITPERESKIKELENMLELCHTAQTKIYDITLARRKGSDNSVAIGLLGDAHIDAVVKKESVAGLNEYNPEVAKRRMMNFFYMFAKLVTHAQRSYNMRQVVLGILGDIINGWIHEELVQTNSMKPMEAISMAKSLIVSGIKMLNEKLNVDKITVVCVVGNHARTTQKNQFANAVGVNMEYYMYKDIEETCRLMGMKKVSFIIPESEVAVVEIFEKRLLMTHGTHIKYGGGVGGLTVPLMKWFNRLPKSLGIDIAFLGHFHQGVFTEKFVVNPSLIGYDDYAFGKMFDYQEPCQFMVIFHESLGITALQKIYVE